MTALYITWRRCPGCDDLVAAGKARLCAGSSDTYRLVGAVLSPEEAAVAALAGEHPQPIDLDEAAVGDPQCDRRRGVHGPGAGFMPFMRLVREPR